MRYVWGMVFLCWGQEPLSLTDTFTIDPRKRLRSYELARKKEGRVFVGYPAVGYDPLRSIGAAAAVALAYNGPKTDPSLLFSRIGIIFSRSWASTCGRAAMPVLL